MESVVQGGKPLAFYGLVHGVFLWALPRSSPFAELLARPVILAQFSHGLAVTKSKKVGSKPFPKQFLADT